MAPGGGDRLDIVRARLAGAPAVIARGTLQAATAPALQATLRRAGAGATTVVVDLGAVTEADRAGWVVTQAALRRLVDRGGAVVVIAPPPALRAALEAGGPDRRLVVVGDAAAATTALAGRPPARGARPAAREMGERRRRAATEHRWDGLLADAALVLDEALGDPDLDLERVAQRIASSRRHLQRVYAELAGTSFREELAAVRMQRALELLRGTDLAVGEIAGRVGYRQPAQFAKAFRRHHGLPPRAFRRGSRASGGAEWQDARTMARQDTPE